MFRRVLASGAGALFVAVVAGGCMATDGSEPDATPPRSDFGGLTPDAGAADTVTGGFNDRGPPSAPFTGTITGRVVSKGQPVAGARVAFGGRLQGTTSDANGRFSIATGATPIMLRQIGLTAGKVGYFNAGVAVADPATAQTIELEKLELKDDAKYLYKSPDLKDIAPYCVHCHPNQVTPWRQSAHAGSATNPKLHDVYNGTASGFATEAACRTAGGQWGKGTVQGSTKSIDKCYVGQPSVLGFLNANCGGTGQPRCDDPSAPTSARPSMAGPCGSCHAPAVDGTPKANAININAVSGVAKDGVHCDFCHKIDKVTVNERAGIDGSIRVLRPPAIPRGAAGFSRPEIFFGPYTDVTIKAMGSSPVPQFRESGFCSACHQWSSPGMSPATKALIDRKKWPAGLPLQDTYQEWNASPAKTQGMQCQQCHMPAAPYETAALKHKYPPTPGGLDGWKRAYGEVREHSFWTRPPAALPGYVRAKGDPTRASLRNPLKVTVSGSRSATRATVTVKIANTGAGHSMPTGTPSRALLLLVGASAGGAALTATGGYTVPSWVGAIATGALGSGGATLTGKRLTLPAGKTWPTAVKGAVIRFCRVTAVYDNYPGVGYFGNATRSAKEKGLPVVAPVAEAKVVAVSGRSIDLDRAPTVAASATTRYFVGAATPAGVLKVDQNLAVTPLAGAPGYAFGKNTVDAKGQPVPFFRAVDIASDNRVPAGKTAATTHEFDVSGAKGKAVTVRATIIYRRYPWARASQRGWKVVDEVRVHETTILAP